MKTKIIAYDYAKNEKGELKHISDVTKDNKNNQKFYCLSCGEEMIAKLGDQKCHHFAHKSNCSCSNESYLHKLAKVLFKKKFDTSKQVKIKFNRKSFCVNRDKCQLFKEEDCFVNKLEEFNLKDYYDVCEEESSVEKFKADLLLKRKKHIEGVSTDSILIEFAVTHTCTQEKLDSKLRIIEIRINSYRDIVKLLRRKTISQSENVFFYNFKEESSESSNDSEKPISRFIYYKSGSAIVYYDQSCKMGKKIRNSVIELNIDLDKTILNKVYRYGYAYLIKSGKSIRNCSLCRYHRERSDGQIDTVYCSLYGQHSVPKYAKRSEAKECKYYNYDEEHMAEIMSDLQNVKIEEV